MTVSLRIPSTRTSLIRATVVVAFSLFGFHDNGVYVSALQPIQTHISKKTKATKAGSLFYQNETLCEFATAEGIAPVSQSTPAAEDNVYIKNKVDVVPFGRREVDRKNLHPIFKLEFVPDLFMHMDLPQMILLAAMALVASPLLLPLLPLIVSLRKQRWEKVAAASREEYMESFEATTQAYRQSQKDLVDKLLLKQQQEKCQQDILPEVIAVTMATGQEGQGVVRYLAESPEFQNATILALVRNPKSPAAQALTKIRHNVKLVECDSTNVDSLRAALQPAHAVFLATTLNKASAGHWEMNWDGGQYQILQGETMAEACKGLENLRQIVYGTAPMRKWPEGFAVEPPIHYAAKWRVEQLLTEADLPVTFLRKCPYHENFTKLTKAVAKHSPSDGGDSAASTKVAAMGVEGGGAFDSSRKVELQPGEYQIKAFTPPDFTYNMMDPRDTGKWAVIAFSNPSLLIGQSLSVASDALTGEDMARAATECGALGDGVSFSYAQQPRWLFEALAFVEPTFVYISGLQRWSNDGGVYDLDADGVKHVRKLVAGSTWSDHLEREGLGQFTETMADLLPDFTK